MAFGVSRGDQRALWLKPRQLGRVKVKAAAASPRSAQIDAGREDDLSALTPVDGKESQQMTGHNVF